MIFSISSTENHPGGVCDNHFARSPYFAVYDTKTGDLSFLENNLRNMPEKAGPAVVKLLLSLNVGIVVSLEFGEKIRNVLEINKVGMVIIEDNHKTIESIIRTINVQNNQ